MHLELLYCPFGTDAGFQSAYNPDFRLTDLEKALKSGISDTDVDPAKLAAQKKKEVIVRGVLSVTVMSAQDLPAVDLMGKSDPYVVLLMKKTEQKLKTRVFFFLFNIFTKIHRSKCFFLQQIYKRLLEFIAIEGF